MIEQRPILITGAHRSGSTWSGKLLALSPSVGYIHEPFNVTYQPCGCGANVNYWYHYVTREDARVFEIHLRHLLNFRYPVWKTLTRIRDFRDARIFIKRNLEFLEYRLERKRPLIKDPLAFFSADWLSRTFNMETVIMIRHPAAFASSLKRKGWKFPFHHLLYQPELMDAYLSPFENEIEEYARQPKPIILQAALLWKIIHHVIYTFQEKHPKWIFIRHEDLSRDPLKEFEKLYHRLNISFTPEEERKIFQYTYGENPGEVDNDEELLKRDSLANIYNWKTRLGDEEIEQIYEKVEKVSRLFYSEQEWKGGEKQP